MRAQDLLSDVPAFAEALRLDLLSSLALHGERTAASTWQVRRCRHASPHDRVAAPARRVAAPEAPSPTPATRCRQQRRHAARTQCRKRPGEQAGGRGGAARGGGAVAETLEPGIELGLPRRGEKHKARRAGDSPVSLMAESASSSASSVSASPCHPAPRSRTASSWPKRSRRSAAFSPRPPRAICSQASARGRLTPRQRR